MPLHAIAMVAMVLVVQNGYNAWSVSHSFKLCASLTRLTSIAQSSGPHAFLFDRIQKRRIVKTMSKGSGTKAARAIGYEEGAISSFGALLQARQQEDGVQKLIDEQKERSSAVDIGLWRTER